jgi:hypothetical protein
MYEIFSKIFVVSNQVIWPINQEKSRCGSYITLTWLNVTVQQ